MLSETIFPVQNVFFLSKQSLIFTNTQFRYFFQIKTKIVSCHSADSKPVKQDFNGTVILTPSVFPALILFLAGFAGQGVLNEDPTFWLDRD